MSWTEKEPQCHRWKSWTSPIQPHQLAQSLEFCRLLLSCSDVPGTMLRSRYQNDNSKSLSQMWVFALKGIKSFFYVRCRHRGSTDSFTLSSWWSQLQLIILPVRSRDSVHVIMWHSVKTSCSCWATMSFHYHHTLSRGSVSVRGCAARRV